jgi:hypothetical protein
LWDSRAKGGEYRRVRSRIARPVGGIWCSRGGTIL